MQRSSPTPAWLAACALFAIALLLTGGGLAASEAEARAAKSAKEEAPSRMEELPPELQGVGITEKRDTVIPLDLWFKDDLGKDVRLKNYFQGDRPVILTLNYSDCPMLCSMELKGLVASLLPVEWTIGKDFDIITVSIDPKETPEKAASSRTGKKKYVTMYGREEANEGWHFLTSNDEGNIKALADAVGFGYRYSEERQEYLHAAAIMLLTPDGRISRYLYGIEFEPKTVHLSLVEASEGKIGGAMDQLLLFCFHYNSSTGKYGPAAIRIMQLGGALMVLVLGFFLGGFWLREYRRNRAQPVGS